MVLRELKARDYLAYIVGGSVRDVIMGREPKDWDVTTNALPKEIQDIFPDSVYENNFGTVGVKTESEDPKVKIIEVTTFRSEGEYNDFRHPEKIIFVKNIEEDLSRRDFTINALAYDPETDELVDPFGGRADIAGKIVKAVGISDARFKEDALRLMRAVRFASELGFEIEINTLTAIKNNADLLEAIAKERIRDEFSKIIMSQGSGAAWGVVQLENMGLLKNIIPELREGIDVTQNKHHIYTVWEHNLRALDYAANKNASLEVRLGALLHDVGKPRTKMGEGEDSTFHNHEVVGARMTTKILETLHYSKDIVQKTVHLVRHHLFYYNVGEVSEAGVRRFLSRVGIENIDDLFVIREADRIGSGVPKAIPYKMRHLRFMIDKVRKDPIAPKMLKLNGNELMGELKLSPQPKVGWILNALLEEVLDDPQRNDREYLVGRAKELNGLSDQDLRLMAEKAKETKEEYESSEEREMKKKHKV